MSDQEHRIYRLAFDLSMPEDEPPGPIQDRISRLLQNQLTRLIDQTFSEYVKQEDFFVLDRLELDLGRLTIDELDRDFPTALLEALHQALGKLFGPSEALDLKLRRRPVSSNHILVLYELLYRGAYPWWVSNKDKKTPQELLDSLSQKRQEDLTELLYNVSGKEFARKRTILTYEDTTLKQIVRLMEPGAFPFMEEFPDRLQRQHQKAPIVPVNAADFRVIQWDLILSQIARQRGSVFNQKSFVKNILEGLAKTFDKDYHELVQQLLDVSQNIEKSANPNFQLISILRNLAEEATVGRTGSEAIQEGWMVNVLAAIPTAEQQALRQFFSSIFEQNTIPGFASIDQEQWQAAITRLWQTDKKVALKVIRLLAKSGQVGTPYLQQIPLALLQQIVRDTRPHVLSTELAILADFVSLGNAGYFSRLANPELAGILKAHLLVFVVAVPSNTYSSATIWQSALYQIVGDQRAVIREWLKTTLNDLPPISDRLNIGEPTVSVLRTLAGQFDLVFSKRTEQWIFLEHAPENTSEEGAALESREDGTRAAEAVPHAPAEELKEELPAAVQDALTNQQFRTLAAHIRLVIRFTDQGLLPSGAGLPEVEESWKTWANQSVRSLRTWLLQQHNRKEWPNRISANFSGALSYRLFSILEPASGAPLRRLEQWLASTTYWLPGSESTSTRFWRMVWRGWQKLPAGAFTWHQLLQQIIQELDSERLQKSLDEWTTNSGQDEAEVAWLVAVIQANTAITKKEEPLSDLKLAQKSVPDFIAWLIQVTRKSPGKATSQSLLQWIKTHRNSDVAQLFSRLNQDAVLLQSIAENLQEADVILIVRQVNPFLADRILDIIATIRTVNKKMELPLRPVLVPELTKLILQSLLHDRGSIANQKTFTLNMIRQWTNKYQFSFQTVLQTIRLLMQDIAPLFHDLSLLTLLRTIIHDELMVVEEAQNEQPTRQTRQKPRLDEQPKDYRKLWDEEEVPLVFQEIWQVENAGLVLLWPYLSTLFERLGLLTDDQFVDEEKQQQAALLLEYLVCGELPKEEYGLVLNKVLCGIPLEIPLRATLEISPDITALTEGLLQAVIAHWSVLQDTTVEAFRETFLQRTGHFGLTEKGWVLEVEHQSYDLLLSQLPWGISVVNLSWLEHPIEVRWTV